MPAFTRMGVQAEVQGYKAFSKNLNNMQKDIAKTGDSTKRMADQSNRAGAMVGDAFRTMATAAAGFLGAQAMIRFGKSSLDAAVQVEQLGIATENLSRQIGSSSDAMVASIQRASVGTIDQLTAMQAANKAMLFGIIESEDEMAELTQVAITLGAAMGQTAAKSLDDLTVALGRNSPMILDNLGISLKLSDAYLLYAESIGKSVDALTEEEKTMAFRKAALIEGKKRMEELGGITETTAIKQERLNRAWKDFQVEFGNLMKGIGGGIDPLTKFVDKLAEGAKAWQFVFEAKQQIRDFRDELIQSSDSMNDYNKRLREIKETNPGLARALKLSTVEFYSQKKALEDSKVAQLEDVDIRLRTSRVVRDETANIDDLTEAIHRQEGGLMDITNAQRLSLSIADIRAESLKIEEQASKDAKTATDELTRAIEAQMQVYRDIQIEQTNYILGLKQGTLDAEAAEASYYQNRAGIAQKSNDAVADADEKLKDELAAAEEEWNAIKTQLLGDWDAKGQEQTEKDLAWHKAIYENRIGEAHVAHAAELKEIEATGTEQTAALAVAYEQQKADQETANEQALLLSALRNMEAKGEFEKYEQLAGKSAEQAAQGFEAGTIAMTDAIATDIAGAMEGLETTAEGVTGTVESNEDVMATLFDNTARAALLAGGEMSDVFLGIGTGTTTMAGTAETAFTKTQTEWNKLVTGLQTSVTEVKWKELGIEPGEKMVEGIIKGVDNKTAALEAAMKRLAEAAQASYEKAIGSGSPAQEYVPLGISMVQGIIKGMEEMEHDLTKEGHAVIERALFDWLNTFKGTFPGFRGKLHKEFKNEVRKIMEGMTITSAETMGEAAGRIHEQILDAIAQYAHRYPGLAEQMGASFHVVLDALGDHAEETFFTISQQMAGLLGAARVFGGLGGTAAQMLRAREIRPGEERIRAMEDELALLEDQGIELQRQAELVAEIAVERAKVEEHERAILAFEEQQQNLRFLEQQIKLLDLIDKYQLDAQQILGGVQLGVGADLTAVMEAMTAALQEVIQVTQSEVFGAAGLGYAAVAPAQVSAPATTATTVNQSFGDVNMGGAMGQAQFAAWMEQIVVGAMTS